VDGKGDGKKYLAEIEYVNPSEETWDKKGVFKVRWVGEKKSTRV